jgi:hypothetical protein
MTSSTTMSNRSASNAEIASSPLSAVVTSQPSRRNHAVSEELDALFVFSDEHFRHGPTPCVLRNVGTSGPWSSRLPDRWQTVNSAA